MNSTENNVYEVPQSVLFEKINRIEEYVREEQEYFFNTWTKMIMENTISNYRFSIKKQLDHCGGFILYREQYSQMAHPLKLFFDCRAKGIGDRIWLRGYDYYETDPLVHRHSVQHDYGFLWSTYLKRWNSYPDNMDFSFLLDDRISVENWIGILGFLEYFVNELTSWRWFQEMNKNVLISKLGKTSYNLLLSETDIYCKIVCKAIACALKFEIRELHSLLITHYNQLRSSSVIFSFLSLNLNSSEIRSIRSIREGDTLHSLFAAYLIKLKPFIEKNKFKNIEIISNAFGAMNLGLIIGFLIENPCRVIHRNVLYAHNRSAEDYAYKNPLINRYVEINCNELDSAKTQRLRSDQAGVAIVVDDSVFSGDSFNQIKAHMNEEKPAYLLPLTINTKCLKYCRTGVSEKDIYGIACLVEELSLEIGGRFPPFCSLWDYGEAEENKIVTDNEEFNTVIKNDGLRMKHLWAIFLSDIFSEYQSDTIQWGIDYEFK